MERDKAVVLFSGGLDSTTALNWACKEFKEVHALIFHYAQKHSIEVEMAGITAEKLGVKYTCVDFSLQGLVETALIDKDKDIPDSISAAKDKRGVPLTYVPFRNGIFLSVAAAYAESRGIYDIITGFNLIDTPDYPDTTEEFAQKMESAVNQGTSASITGIKFKIHTPLIKKTKKEIVEMGLALGTDYSYSVSCYRGEEMPCLHCPSCESRNRAFEELGMEDPLIARLKKEKEL